MSKNRTEGWKVTKRSVKRDKSGVGLERVERVRTAGILKKLAQGFFDELSKIANGDEEEMSGKAPSQEAVIKFLDKNPKPTDDQFHEWAEGQGYNVHKAEQVAYRILSDIVNTGKSKGKMPPGTPGKEVKQGVKVEKEHTPNPTIARKVVADHITETGPGYYPALLKMEKDLEKKGEPISASVAAALFAGGATGQIAGMIAGHRYGRARSLAQLRSGLRGRKMSFGWPMRAHGGKMSSKQFSKFVRKNKKILKNPEKYMTRKEIESLRKLH